MTCSRIIKELRSICSSQNNGVISPEDIEGFRGFQGGSLAAILFIILIGAIKKDSFGLGMVTGAGSVLLVAMLGALIMRLSASEDITLPGLQRRHYQPIQDSSDESAESSPDNRRGRSLSL